MSPLILVVAVSHNMEERMTRIKILGLAIGASLLVFGYEPIAEATPMAAPLSEVEASTGVVVQHAYCGLPAVLRDGQRGASCVGTSTEAR